VQLRSAKLATPELGKFFPELPSVIAKSTRQRTLCPRPLLAKRPHFIYFPFHINKHIYIYIPWVWNNYSIPEPSQPRTSFPATHTNSPSLRTSLDIMGRETPAAHDLVLPPLAPLPHDLIPAPPGVTPPGTRTMTAPVVCAPSERRSTSRRSAPAAGRRVRRRRDAP
jgi:hypothetical protein